MKLTTKTLKCAMGGAALATILATAASAQSPSWPTPPRAAGPEFLWRRRLKVRQRRDQNGFAVSPARLGQMLAPIALSPDDLLADVRGRDLSA